jgi:hypothetical protein
VLRKACNRLMLVGSGWVSTACTWLRRGSTPAADTLWPRNLTAVAAKTHFLLLLAGYNDVIQVAEDEGEARQDAVHPPLEGVARVAQPGVQMAVFLMFAGCIGI